MAITEKIVTLYITDDGREYYSREAAEAYEQVRGLELQLDGLGCVSSQTDTASLAEWILQNFTPKEP